jgi:hypothetical protein
VPAAAHGSTDAYSRRADNRKPSVRAASGLPPDAAPTGGMLARRRIAIARFGTDVAAAGGIGPALADGLDPADYPVVPGGVPQYPRPGNTPRSTWGYVSGTRSYTRRRWPNCTC